MVVVVILTSAEASNRPVVLLDSCDGNIIKGAERISSLLLAYFYERDTIDFGVDTGLSTVHTCSSIIYKLLLIIFGGGRLCYSK